MARTWVLRTETKGTGAQMVPLESVQQKSSPEVEPLFVPRKKVRPHVEESTRRPPRRFKIVDVMTRETLVDDAGAREAVEALRGVRSVVDVEINVWQPDKRRWRLLTFDEARTMLSVSHQLTIPPRRPD